jgi:peptidyl-dipeptidase Dcp
VRQARYDLDDAQLKPYFELESVLHNGVFYAANRLFGLTFKPRPDLPLYHPDVRVWEVFDEDGTPLGLFIGDFWARDSKRGGAWMNPTCCSRAAGHAPVVGNHQNIPKPPAGEPTLMTFDEVETMFHEFGHALHGLFSDVRYPRFSGTSVPRDFVEFPSQVNEMWAFWPEVLANYAKHYQTGEPLPAGAAGAGAGGAAVQRGLPHHRVRGRRAPRPGLAPARRRRARRRDQAFEAEALASHRHGLRAGAAALPQHLLLARLRRRLRGGLLRLHLERGARRRCVDWFKENGGLKRENGDRLRATCCRGAAARTRWSSTGLRRPRSLGRAAAEAPRPARYRRRRDPGMRAPPHHGGARIPAGPEHHEDASAP